MYLKRRVINEDETFNLCLEQHQVTVPTPMKKKRKKEQISENVKKAHLEVRARVFAAGLRK